MDNEQLQNAFSVDVEDYYHVSAFDKVVARKDWSDMQPRVVENTARMLDLLDEHDIQATFFVLGWVAERHAKLVRRISDAGHEIGCHGYSHRKIYDQDRITFEKETYRAKSILEDCVGAPVHGYRAASFSVTKRSLWALDVIGEAGFKYDSSIYPIWHDNYGIPGAETGPSRLVSPLGHELIEFPLSTVEVLKSRLPVGGGGYFRLYPYWLTRAMLLAIENAARPINFYCHPWEGDIGQPRFESASWRSRFRHYNNLSKFESRLRRLLTDFSFTTCLNVLEGRFGNLTTEQ